MTDRSTTPTLQEQAPLVLSQIAGYVGHRTIALGLRNGLIATLADTGGLTADALAGQLGFDSFYVAVWCRSAVATGMCETDGDRFRLAPHIATLLLDTGSPAYAGGVFSVLEQHEVFDRFEQHLATGERLWWNETSPEWIAEVAGTGTPIYTDLRGTRCSEPTRSGVDVVTVRTSPSPGSGVQLPRP